MDVFINSIGESFYNVYQKQQQQQKTENRNFYSSKGTMEE